MSPHASPGADSSTDHHILTVLSPSCSFPRLHDSLHLSWGFDSQVFLQVMTFPGTAGLPASWADCVFVGDLLGLAVTLQVGCYGAAPLCFQTPGRPSTGAQHLTDGDNSAPWTPGFLAASCQFRHGQSSHKSFQLPLQKSPHLCSKLSSQDRRQQYSNIPPHPSSLSNQIWLFQTTGSPMEPGSAPGFTQAVVWREEERGREQSITFVALSAAAVWQMSSTV